MKPVIIIAIAFGLLIPIPFYDSVYAYTNQHDVSISSSGSQFGPAKIRIDYTVTVDVERPSTLDPGEAFTVTVHPRDGRVSYNIEILGESISIPLYLNLGERVAFTVTPGIDAYVLTSASSNVQISGPVSTKQQTLSWQTSTPQIIRSTVNNNVGSSGDVVVRIPIKIDINSGLTLNLLGIIEENIAEKNLGTFSAHPVIEEHISINRPDVSATGSSGSLGWIFLIIIIIIIVLVIRVISKRRKQRSSKRKKIQRDKNIQKLKDKVEELEKDKEKKE